MEPIHLNVSPLTAATAQWFAAAPTQQGVHPACTPVTDAFSVAVSAALADWPAVHETLAADRMSDVAKLAADNSGTAGVISVADETNTGIINDVTAGGQ